MIDIINPGNEILKIIKESESPMQAYRELAEIHGDTIARTLVKNHYWLD